MAYLLGKEILLVANNKNNTWSLAVNCSDIFAWACADSEPLNSQDELRDLWDMYIKDPDSGASVWSCKQRNSLPQKPVYDHIMKSGKWDLNSMGLEPNFYDKIIQDGL